MSYETWLYLPRHVLTNCEVLVYPCSEEMTEQKSSRKVPELWTSLIKINEEKVAFVSFLAQKDESPFRSVHNTVTLQGEVTTAKSEIQLDILLQ